MPEPPPKQPKSRKPSKRTELEQWLAAQKPVFIGVPERDSIHAAIGPISDSYLRKLLRECGVPLHPLVEGVRQENLDALERSLLAMPVNPAARKVVIEAKDHARFALKNHPEKEEMILWMLTWLENPEIFPPWVKLRRERLRAENETAGS
jgi:hypothetical protein